MNFRTSQRISELRNEVRNIPVKRFLKSTAMVCQPKYMNMCPPRPPPKKMGDSCLSKRSLKKCPEDRGTFRSLHYDCITLFLFVKAPCEPCFYIPFPVPLLVYEERYFLPEISRFLSPTPAVCLEQHCSFRG